MSMGLIVYCGIDEFEDEIVKIIVPNTEIDSFYYNCGSKFITEHKGNIIFANGNCCLIYEFKNGKFIMKKQINALLQKRQRKGGQSAVRIARLAEETRHNYISKIIDHLNMLDRNCKSVLFGSSEITTMILSMKTLIPPVNYGGFLEFDLNTIKNTRKWIEYIDSKNDISNVHVNKYKLIVECLDIYDKLDRLDFSIEKANEMEFCLTHNKDIPNSIPFPKIDSEYYDRLKPFEYIGVKYFTYQDEHD